MRWKDLQDEHNELARRAVEAGVPGVRLARTGVEPVGAADARLAALQARVRAALGDERAVELGRAARDAVTSAHKSAARVDDTPIWEGPSRPHVVVIEYSDGSRVEHKSMAPNWRRAVALALRAVVDTPGGRAVRLTIEER